MGILINPNTSPAPITAQRGVSSLASDSRVAESFSLQGKSSQFTHRKGFSAKDFSSACLGIQSCISNSGEEYAWCCLDCKPLEEGLTLRNHMPGTTSYRYKSLCRPNRPPLYPGLCEYVEDNQKAEPHRLARVCISNAQHGYSLTKAKYSLCSDITSEM